MLCPDGQSPISGESTDMLRLRTFGGLTLARGEEDLTGAATQRRRLAILTLLAVSRDAGMSRDKLQAYLWPDSDAERARHVLNQLLYAQRRHVGPGNLFSGRKTLRLNREVIWTDVGFFDDALDRGLREEALEVYRGPFLDGFFLGEVAEFDRWVETHRERLSRRAIDAAKGLARQALAADDHHQAATWWQRATDLDPLDASVMLGLVKALADGGDRPGAIRRAQKYQDTLQAEIGVAPDPELAAFVKGL